MFWRVLHDTLKWLWPALFSGAVAVGGIAIAASEVWEGAKQWTELRFSEVATLLSQPPFWIAALFVFLAWLAALIWSGHKVTALRAPGMASLSARGSEALPEPTRPSGWDEPLIPGGSEARCPEMPIWRAVRYVAEFIDDTDEKNCYPRARADLRQAACEGSIDVWGQKEIPPTHLKEEQHSGLWTPISRDYWHSYELNPLSTGEFFLDREHTWKEGSVSKRGERYWNLKVREQQIRSRWRKPRPHSGLPPGGSQGWMAN